MAALPDISAPAFSDLELIASAQSGDRQAMDALLERYEPLIAAQTRGLFARGLEHDDLLQEARIAFWSAVHSYRPETGVTFVRFASLCVRRRTITAVAMARRVKHRFLTMADSFEARLNDKQTLLDILADEQAADPERAFFDRSDYRATMEALSTALTDVERCVLAARLDGLSYADIAEQMGRTEKTVDNALWRIKRKLRRYLAERAALEEAV